MQITKDDLTLFESSINCEKIKDGMLKVDDFTNLTELIEETFNFFELSNHGILNTDDMGFLAIDIKSKYVNRLDEKELLNNDIKNLSVVLTDFMNNIRGKVSMSKKTPISIKNRSFKINTLHVEAVSKKHFNTSFRDANEDLQAEIREYIRNLVVDKTEITAKVIEYEIFVNLLPKSYKKQLDSLAYLHG